MAGISARGREEIARLTGRGQRVIGVEEAARLLGVSKRDAAKRLARWASQGWLRRIRRGAYIPVPIETEHPAGWTEDPTVLADIVWRPCFFTGWTAANHWGLTEQVFRTTVLKTSTRVRQTRQELIGQQYLVLHVNESSFWGLKVVWRENYRLQFADSARAVIDILDDPRLGGGIRLVAEIVANYLESGAAQKLVEYGDRLGNMAVFKRLGYILEELGLKNSELVTACLDRVSAGTSLLDPTAPPKGRRIPHWGLRANVQLGPQDAT